MNNPIHSYAVNEKSLYRMYFLTGLLGGLVVSCLFLVIVYNCFKAEQTPKQYLIETCRKKYGANWNTWQPSQKEAFKETIEFINQLEK